jgi:hypothetical protein
VRRPPLDLALPAAIAVGLVAVLALAPAPAPGGRGGRLVPGLRADDLAELAIATAAGPRVLIRFAGRDAASLVEPFAAPLDPDAARALGDTLEYLASRRSVARGPEHGLDPPRARVRIVRRGGPPVELAIGGDAEGLARIWVATGGDPRAHLVDRDAIATLMRGPDELRARRPFAARAEAVTLRVGDAVLDVDRDGVALDGRRLPIAPDARAALDADLRAVRLERFGPAAAPGDAVVAIARGPAARVTAGGPCPDDAALVAATTSLGDGCVAPAAIAALEAWGRAPWRLIDRAPFGIAPARVASLDARLDGRAARGTRAEGAGEAIRAWLDALAAAVGEPVALADATPAGAIAIEGEGADGRPRREVAALLRARDGGLLLRRGDEGFGFRLAVGFAERVNPVALRPLALLEREPSDVRAIALRRGAREVGGATRGATLEAWTVRGALRAEDAAPIAEALARLRAVAWLDRPASLRDGFDGRALHVELEPGGPGGVHVLELGAARADGGCLARLDRATAIVVLDPARCATLVASFGNRSANE